MRALIIVLLGIGLMACEAQPGYEARPVDTRALILAQQMRANQPQPMPLPQRGVTCFGAGYNVTCY